jgi:hypothetical protein
MRATRLARATMTLLMQRKLDPAGTTLPRPRGALIRRVALKGTSLVASVVVAATLAACADNYECDGHPCVGNWKRDMALGGSVVQCADGAWSHGGGLSGVCASRGGERKPRDG